MFLYSTYSLFLNNIIYLTENILGTDALMNLVSVIPTVLFSFLFLLPYNSLCSPYLSSRYFSTV